MLPPAFHESLRSGQEILLRSYLLRDQGEQKLEAIIYGILKHYQRIQLAGPAHAAIREIVQNASKANLKRILFEERKLDASNPTDYETGMRIFKDYLVKTQLARYRPVLRERNLYFHVSILHTARALAVSVVNYFPLLSREEERIREKFKQSRTLDNLYDFFMKFGDNTEGAGMGIAMVEILLEQAGVDRHNFTLYSTTGKTIARLILPLDESFVSPRQQFLNIQREEGLSAEQLRHLIRSGKIALKYY
jgi:hypothetical protein